MPDQEQSGESARRPRLWVISELYYPEETSTGYYLTRIAEGLVGDFDVRVICGQPNYSARGIRAPKREVHRNVDIFRARGTRLNKNVIPFRVLNMLTLSVSIFSTALRRFRKGDKVLVVTTPPSLPFIAAAASLLKGAGYVLLIHDNYPEILVAAAKAKPESAIVGFANRCNRWLYKYASKIIVVGRDMFELVGRKTAGLDIPIDIIPNWAELERVEPRPRGENELLEELGIKEKIVLLYAGNMGYPNDIESIIECAAQLRDDDRFCFLFLGAGVKRKWLERTVAGKALSNVRILDPRPREEQNVFLNACDVGVVSLVDRMWGVSMPSRTYNILAAGKPILALTEPDSELDRVVREDNAGWSVRPNDPGALRETLEEIAAGRRLFEDLGRNARRAALGKYSLDTAVENYRRALK
ncbi:MAG: glycosyltransferase family 4 protein [Acidobacteria bacterium]|nr:glycosyltransferase family 4 protein [Acidobacteriota bacterium]